MQTCNSIDTKWRRTVRDTQSSGLPVIAEMPRFFSCALARTAPGLAAGDEMPRTPSPNALSRFDIPGINPRCRHGTRLTWHHSARTIIDRYLVLHETRGCWLYRASEAHGPNSWLRSTSLDSPPAIDMRSSAGDQMGILRRVFGVFEPLVLNQDSLMTETRVSE